LAEEIAVALSRHAVVGIDTMVWIYNLDRQSLPYAVATQVLRLIESGAIAGVTSEVTIMELMVRPLRMNAPTVAAGYESLIVTFPNLAVASLDRVAVRRAAELRARFNLHPLDALQLAACIEHGATTFVTNDLRLGKVTDIDIVMLDDFIEAY
jgi:predicted nucleic acid-binding protein